MGTIYYLFWPLQYYVVNFQVLHFTSIAQSIFHGVNPTYFDFFHCMYPFYQETYHPLLFQQLLWVL